jgi:hypothetical protein
MKTINKTFLRPLIGALLILMCVTSCSDFIEVDTPRTEIVKATVFSSDASAASAVRGIYSLMMASPNFISGGLEEYTGIASDELISYATRNERLQFYQNSISPNNADVFQFFWQEPYKFINNANGILEGLENSNGMTVSGRNQTEGEAKFIRAFCHFYLAALFGDVPYLTSTDYQVNAKAERVPFKDVLTKIESDLIDARELLTNDFTFSNGERIQPNKVAATALLARVYLYLNEWEKAELMATEVINNTTYVLQSDLNMVFLANSDEAIWQLQPVIPGTNAPQGQLFILTNAPSGISRRVSMTPELVAAFEDNDQRKVKWTGTFTNTTGSWNYIYKYKIRLNTEVTEYAMVLRLAEQYLIRAEARAQRENIEGSQSDLNIIRNRAELPNTTATDKTTLLKAIEHERRIELCGETGHRWLDLKRTGRIDQVMLAVKPQWQTTDALFPIPQSERLLNPNLSQNQGY